MHKKFSIWAILALAGWAVLAGCRRPAPTRLDIATSDRPRVQQASPQPSITTPPERPTPALTLTSAEVPTPPATNAPLPEALPPGVTVAQRPVRLSLFDAIETSLQQNPDLNTLRRNEGIGMGVLGVARTYPFNPFVQVQATPLQQKADNGSGTVYHYVLVMQTVQLAHQQRHREETALAQLSSVRWNIVQAELNNIAQTERLYFTALYQRGIRDLVRATADVNAQLLVVSEKQLQAGQISGADAAIVRLDARSTRQQAWLAEANYQTALLDLRRHLNLPLVVPCELVGLLDEQQWSAASPEQLLLMKCAHSPREHIPQGHQALLDLAAGRPDVLAARADLAAARANANLANAARTPDLQVGPYYQRNDSGTTFWGLRAQMDVPVINNGEPLLRQRQAEARQRQTAWEQLHARATIEAQVAIDRYERARQLAAESGDGVRLEIPSELQRLEAQFTQGEVDVLRVVTARNSLIQLRRAQLDTLNELAQAAAGLTSATGVAPQAIVAPRPASIP